MNKIAWVLIFVIILAISIILAVRSNQKRISDILESPSYADGSLIDIRFEKGKTTIGDFTFKVSGVQYQSSKGDGRLQHLSKFVFNRKFPVIYNTHDPRKNDLLIFPSDFEKYNVVFPDSLNWIRKLENRLQFALRESSLSLGIPRWFRRNRCIRYSKFIWKTYRYGYYHGRGSENSS